MGEHQLKQYRVHMTVKGGISRPSYDGYVDVYAADEESAGERAKRELHRTTFPDVWFDAFMVRSVECRG